VEVNLNLIIDICKSYSEFDLFRVYTLDNIPEKKLKNAIENFPLTNANSVLMLLDSSAFGSGNTGIAVCDNGFFYKNAKSYIPSYKYFSWEEFSSVNVYLKGSNLFFGNDYYAFLPVASKVRKAMEELLKKIQQSLLFEGNQDKNKEEIAPLDKNPKISSKDNVWFLAIDKKQYGPMGTFEIEKMIIDKFFNPELTFAWRQGMDNWELFSNVPEFRTIIEGLNKNTIKPPPMPKFYKPNSFHSRGSVIHDIQNLDDSVFFSNTCTDTENNRIFIDDGDDSNNDDNSYDDDDSCDSDDSD